MTDKIRDQIRALFAQLPPGEMDVARDQLAGDQAEACKTAILRLVESTPYPNICISVAVEADDEGAPDLRFGIGALADTEVFSTSELLESEMMAINVHDLLAIDSTAYPTAQQRSWADGLAEALRCWGNAEFAHQHLGSSRFAGTPGYSFFVYCNDGVAQEDDLKVVRAVRDGHFPAEQASWAIHCELSIDGDLEKYVEAIWAIDKGVSARKVLGFNRDSRVQAVVERLDVLDASATRARASSRLVSARLK